MAKARFTPQKVITALKEARGAVYLAAESLRCTPTTVYNLIKSNPDVKDVYESERDKMLDIAENALYDAIVARESWAIVFFLKTRGKSRGYGDKLEVSRSEEPEQLKITISYVEQTIQDD